MCECALALSCGSVVIEELLLRLEARVCMKWDLVLRKGDPGDWMGFISSGTVAVLDPESKTDVVVRILTPGAHFGELALFDRPGGHRRAASLQALSWVQLQVRAVLHYSSLVSTK